MPIFPDKIPSVDLNVWAPLAVKSRNCGGAGNCVNSDLSWTDDDSNFVLPTGVALSAVNQSHDYIR